MKVTKTFIKCLATTLEQTNTAFGTEIENQSETEWNITFENSNCIKIEIFFSSYSNNCIIGAYDSRGNYKWFCSYNDLAKVSRDYFFFCLAKQLHIIDDEMCRINDAIWEEENATSAE